MRKQRLCSHLRVAALLCAVLAAPVACDDPTAPIDPALSGRWLQWGIDSYAQLILEKRGSTVTGTMGYGGFGGTSELFPVRGIAAAQHVVLKWNEAGRAVTFDAILPSADSNELTGRMSVDGGDPGPLTTFTRAVFSEHTPQAATSELDLDRPH